MEVIKAHRLYVGSPRSCAGSLLRILVTRPGAEFTCGWFQKVQDVENCKCFLCFTFEPPPLDYEHSVTVLWSAASISLAQELPSEGLRDWSSIMPSGFASVWRRRTTKDPPPANPSTLPAAPGKKAGSGSKASAAPAAAEPVAAAAAAAAVAGSGAADAQLKLTAELAVASSLLSYPLTLLHCLGVPGLSAVQEPAAGSVPPGGSGAGPSKGRGEGRVGAAAAAGAAAATSASALGAVRERLTDSPGTPRQCSSVSG